MICSGWSLGLFIGPRGFPPSPLVPPSPLPYLTAGEVAYTAFFRYPRLPLCLFLASMKEKRDKKQGETPSMLLSSSPLGLSARRAPSPTRLAAAASSSREIPEGNSPSPDSFHSPRVVACFLYGEVTSNFILFVLWMERAPYMHIFGVRILPCCCSQFSSSHLDALPVTQGTLRIRLHLFFRLSLFFSLLRGWREPRRNSSSFPELGNTEFAINCTCLQVLFLRPK